MLDDILLLIAGLAGLGGFISVLVNLLKLVGIVKDGTSEKWFQILNLVAFVAVMVIYLMQIQMDWVKVDDWLILLSGLLGYVVQILGGQLTYQTIGGKAPVIGFSFSKREDPT